MLSRHKIMNKENSLRENHKNWKEVLQKKLAPKTLYKMKLKQKFNITGFFDKFFYICFMY